VRKCNKEQQQNLTAKHTAWASPHNVPEQHIRQEHCQQEAGKVGDLQSYTQPQGAENKDKGQEQFQQKTSKMGDLQS
jgi:hypothetical protein